MYTAEGTTTPNLSLAIDPAFFYEAGNPRVPIRCVITNACGESIISNVVRLTVCAADFNCDGVMDFFDYLDFVAAFAGGLAPADYNHDSVIDFFDYLDFVQAFSAGC